jgi:hypothetical protein
LGGSRRTFASLGGEIRFWQLKTETNSFHSCQLLIDILVKSSNSLTMEEKSGAIEIWKLQRLPRQSGTNAR